MYVKNIQWDTYYVEYLDLRMPYIKDLSMAIDIEYLIKALFIMLIFTQFLSKITTLAASLTDGKSIQGKNIGALDTSVKTYGAVYGAGTRAARAGQKLYNFGKNKIRGNDAAKKDAPINAKAPQVEVTSNTGPGSNNSNVAPTSASPASAPRPLVLKMKIKKLLKTILIQLPKVLYIVAFYFNIVTINTKFILKWAYNYYLLMNNITKI